MIGIAGRAGPLRIARLDQPAAALMIRLDRGFADLAASTTGLAPGGLYQLTSGARSLVVRVDAAAWDGDGPALGRLIAF